jgi:hypothetical protein
MLKRNFEISLYSILIWTLLMGTIDPTNGKLRGIINPADGSMIKFVISLLIWLSFFSAFIYAIKKYNLIKKNIPPSILLVFLFLSTWNIINIFRSFMEGTATLKTMFGNSFTSLSLLIPVAMVFGIFHTNLRSFRKILFSFLTIGLLVSPLGIPFLLSQNFFFFSIYFILIFGTIFLIPTLFYETILHKLIIVSSCLIMIILVTPDVRANFLRVILLLLTAICIYLYQKLHLKIILKLSFVMLVIPFYLLYIGYKSETSIFQAISKYSDSNETFDTRTFLYQEVLLDLKNTNSLIAGKGANGSYFSEYFLTHPGDSDTRLTVEVGILTILLKGGIIAVILNIYLFIYAIYLSLFRSNNYYAIAMGYFLLIHVILLFIENIVSYSLYNFIVWFCVGLCLNNHFRTLTSDQITILINGNAIYYENIE